MAVQEVIYDLTTTVPSRPHSRNIAVQTSLPRQPTKKVHSNETLDPRLGNNSALFTLQNVWLDKPILNEYAQPKDTKIHICKPSAHKKKKPAVVPKVKLPVNASKDKKKEKIHSCIRISQKSVVKYNLLLSVLINVLILALGGTGFMSGLSGYMDKAHDFKFVMIAATFSMCYAVLSLTMDFLALLAIYRQRRELFLPWLIWNVLDMAVYVSVMVLVILFATNFLILLAIFKIIWTLFVWINVKDLYGSNFARGGGPRRKLKTDILY